MKTQDLPPHLTIAKPAWGVLVWRKGEAELVEAHADRGIANSAVRRLGSRPGISAELVPIGWWVTR